jgi:hypothetical protein
MPASIKECRSTAFTARTATPPSPPVALAIRRLIHRATTHAGPPARTRSPADRRAAAASPTEPRGPQRAEARDRLRITADRTQLRRPRPGAVGDLDPDDAVPSNDRDRNRLPRRASVTLSRTASPAVGTPPSRPPSPREITRAAGRTHRDARSTRRPTSRPDTPRNGHRNPVKRLPTPLPGPDSRPLCVRGHRNTPPYSATR